MRRAEEETLIDAEGVADTFLWNEYWDNDTCRMVALPAMRNDSTNSAVPLGISRSEGLLQLWSCSNGRLSFSGDEEERIAAAIDKVIADCRSRLQELNASSKSRIHFHSILRCEVRLGRSTVAVANSLPAVDDTGNSIFPDREETALLRDCVERLESLNTGQKAHKVAFATSLESGLFFPSLPDEVANKLYTAVSRHVKSLIKANGVADVPSDNVVRVKAGEGEEEEKSSVVMPKQVDDEIRVELFPQTEVVLEVPSGETWTITGTWGDKWERLRSRRVIFALTCPSILHGGFTSVQLVLVEELRSSEPIPPVWITEAERHRSRSSFLCSAASTISSVTDYDSRVISVDGGTAKALLQGGQCDGLTSFDIIQHHSTTTFYVRSPHSDNEVRITSSCTRSQSYVAFAAAEVLAAIASGTLNLDNQQSIRALVTGSLALINNVKFDQKNIAFLSKKAKKAAPKKGGGVSFTLVNSGCKTKDKDATAITKTAPLEVPSVVILSAQNYASRPSTMVTNPFHTIPKHLEPPAETGAEIVVASGGKVLLHKRKKLLDLNKPYALSLEEVSSLLRSNPPSSLISDDAGNSNKLWFEQSTHAHSFALQLFHNPFNPDKSPLTTVLDSFGESVGSLLTIFARQRDCKDSWLFVRVNTFNAKDTTSMIISNQEFAEAMRHYRGEALRRVAPLQENEKDVSSVNIRMEKKRGGDLMSSQSSSSEGLGNEYDLKFSVYFNSIMDWEPENGRRLTNTIFKEVAFLEFLWERIVPQCVHDAKAVKTSLGTISATSASNDVFRLDEAYVCVDDYHLVDGRTTYLERRIHHLCVRSLTSFDTSCTRFHWFLPVAYCRGKVVHHQIRPIDITLLVGARLGKLLNSPSDEAHVESAKMVVEGKIQSIVAQTSKIFNTCGMNSAFLRGNEVAMALMESAAATADEALVEMACEDSSLWMTHLGQLGIHSISEIIDVEKNGNLEKVFQSCGIPREIQNSMFFPHSGKRSSKRLELDFGAIIPADSPLRMPSRSVVDLPSGQQLVPVMIPCPLFFSGFGDLLAGDVVLIGAASTKLVDECVQQFTQSVVFESNDLVLVLRHADGSPLTTGVRTLPFDHAVWKRPENMQFFVTRNKTGISSVYVNGSSPSSSAAKKLLRTPTPFDFSQLANREVFTPPKVGEAMFKDGMLVCMHRGPGLQELAQSALLCCKPSRVIKSAIKIR